MIVSVILCTFNRCDSLQIALESAAAQVNLDPGSWELLIIDNNSKDRTAEVAKGFCLRYPDRFRYIFESQQGKSHALNRGIRESKGSILAFMDDDVVVAPDWLKNLLLPFEDSAWIGVGGRIAPPANFVTPEWLALDGPYDLSGILAMFDKGREGKELTEPPFGTNMAFRREVFERCGLFRPDLGPCPGSEIRGEDSEFGRRVFKSGLRLWYQPCAVVHHAIPPGRLCKGYFLRFQFDQGRASIREKDKGFPIWFIPRIYFTIPKIIAGELIRRVVAWIFSIDPQSRFQRKCMVWTNVGQIAELIERIFRGHLASGDQAPALVNGKENRA